MNKNNIKAILFDMDGLLVDSEPLHFEAHRRALEKFGIQITKEDYIQNGVSGGRRSFYEVMQIKYHKPLDINAVRKLKKEIYGELIKQIEVFDGTKRIVEILHRKYRIAVVSNTHPEYIQKTLAHVGMVEYFETISSAKELERGKPFPDVYFNAMKKLGMEASECVAVEDSCSGIEAAKNAGIRCIAIPNEFTSQQDLSRADVVIGSIKEMDKALVEKL
ncbi:MAG: HAD family hydrolase [uncultured bacterium]|nr:MAG: HAD family hydrolase [uncultured bacterium]